MPKRQLSSGMFSECSRGRNLKFSKRADVSAQFNWIFILIIGAIILTFFITIVSKQKTQAEEQISLNVVMAFKTILQSSIVKERVTQMILLPKYDMEFYCDIDTCTDQGCNSGYRVKGSSIDISSDFMAIFSPEYIHGKKMITYSFDWNLPYRVENILILTTDNYRYVLINDSDQRKSALFLTVKPDNLTMDVVKESALSSIRDENHYNVRYIFFNKQTMSPANMIQPDPGKVNVSAVNVVFDSANFGHIDYYRLDQGSLSKTGTVNFFDNATMLAGIFSENQVYYNCNMIKAFNRAQRLSLIYAKKLSNLEEKYYNETEGCGFVFYKKDPAQKIYDLSRAIIVKKSINQTDSQKLYESMQKLAEINKKARDMSCPVIY